MTTAELSTENWHIRLLSHHYNFFKALAEETGDIERGAAARQCRKFLNKTIKEYKQTHNEKVIV